MFKRKPSSNATVDTLIGGKTRINGDVEFNVVGDAGTATFLSVSEHGCIEGSVIAPSVILNGIVKGDIEAGDRIELGSKARVLGNVHYSIIETAVGAQINGKLIHRVKSPDGANQAPGVAISPDTEPAFPAPSNGEE